jgi:hypothetical protein
MGGGRANYAEHVWRGIANFADENSGDFRFVNNSPFSTRYRNNLQLDGISSFAAAAVTYYMVAN